MYNITTYPDGSTYATVNLLNQFTFRLENYGDLWRLHQVVDAKNAIGIKPVITIPWLIDSQADRRFERHQSFGLKLVCDFLGRMKAEFRIYHPHNPSMVEAIMSNVTILRNTDFIRQVVFDKLISKGTDLTNLILMSSDAGGYKPLMALCEELPWRGETYSAMKARAEGEWGLIQLIPREDFNGKDILIVDDLSIYGGTFKGLAKLLRARNCGKLYLAVSAITVHHLGEDPVTNYFDTVFTTNSKYEEYTYGNAVGNPSPSNLEVLKIFETSEKGTIKDDKIW